MQMFSREIVPTQTRRREMGFLVMLFMNGFAMGYLPRQSASLVSNDPNPLTDPRRNGMPRLPRCKNNYDITKNVEEEGGNREK